MWLRAPDRRDSVNSTAMIMDAKSHLTAPPTDDEVEWRTVRVCRQEPNAEYDGTTVVKWGTNFTQVRGEGWGAHLSVRAWLTVAGQGGARRCEAT